MHQITSLQAKHSAIMNTTEKECTNIVSPSPSPSPNPSPSVRVAANHGPGRKTKMM